MKKKLLALYNYISIYLIYFITLKRKPTPLEFKKIKEIVSNGRLLNDENFLLSIFIIANNEYFIKIAYRAILRRDPDSEGLRSYSQLITNGNSYASVLSSLEQSIEHIEVCKKNIFEICDKIIDLHSLNMLKNTLNSNKKHTIVFVPGENWLPFALSLSSRLGADGASIILATTTLDNLIAKKETWLSLIVPFDVLYGISLYLQNKVENIYIHSFGWKQETLDLLKMFPEASLCYYSDGFKNAVEHRHTNIKEVVYFGFNPKNTSIKSRTIEFDEWLQAVRSGLPSNAKLKYRPVNAQTVVCLRYYGIGPYYLPKSELLNLIWDTCLRASEESKKIIIKSDIRNQSLTFDVIEFFKSKSKVEIIDLRELIGKQADQPLEYILETDILANINTYVVFDSSLSYILAHHPKISVNTKIFVGAIINDDQCNFNNDESTKYTVAQTYSNIRYFTDWYVNQLHTEGYCVENLGDTFYLITKNKHATNFNHVKE